MLWGMWEKVKTVGELEKSWGSSRNPWGSHFMGAVTEGCPREAGSDKTPVLLMNRHVCFVAVHFTNTLFFKDFHD